ncbi:MAG: ABC transporter ATP-binding protein [Prevotellaceae bacterium]|jgi:ABC-2 type transport system ATP-binding protein|nr:ABC transporter ATP-binding protein [Prevotellaceae bacterium]
MIEINNLNFSYVRSKKMFNEVNLTFDSGHIYGVLGKNGTGKTTLLNLISGLLFPDQGKLVVYGCTPAKRQPRFLSDLYYVTEEFYMPNLKPHEWAKLYAYCYPCFSSEDYKAYLEAFEIDLSIKADKMSMGQRKKVYLAFALACNTRLLLLDEPTNGLDIPSSVKLRSLLAGLANEERCIIISTHHVRDIEHLIDHLVILDNSTVLLDTSVGTLSQKYDFIPFTGKEPPMSAVYYESNLLGGKAMIPNCGSSSRIDMELLFNAVIHNKIEQ